jgi:hypothetical protein
MKFGNWDNEDAFKIIDTQFDEISTIYTLGNIYHIYPGEVITESGYSVPIQNAKQLKPLFKNQLIIIIEFNEGDVWELPGFRAKDSILPQLKESSFKETRFPDSTDVGICQICYEPLKSENNKSDVSVIENCGHMFHTDCVKEHIELRKTCPICRTPVGLSFKKVAPQYIPVSSTNFGKRKINHPLKRVSMDIRYLKLV